MKWKWAQLCSCFQDVQYFLELCSHFVQSFITYCSKPCGIRFDFWHEWVKYLMNSSWCCDVILDMTGGKNSIFYFHTDSFSRLLYEKVSCRCAADTVHHYYSNRWRSDSHALPTLCEQTHLILARSDFKEQLVSLRNDFLVVRFRNLYLQDTELEQTGPTLRCWIRYLEMTQNINMFTRPPNV